MAASKKLACASISKITAFVVHDSFSPASPTTTESSLSSVVIDNLTYHFISASYLSQILSDHCMINNVVLK